MISLDRNEGPDYAWKGRNLWPYREPRKTKSKREERTKGETKKEEKEKEVDDIVKGWEESLLTSTPSTKETEQQEEVEKVKRSEETAKEEKESLGPGTPQGKKAEQQEEVEKVARSEETAKEEKESLGPGTPTHLNQDPRAVLDDNQAVKGKHRSVDTVSLTSAVKGSPTASEKRKKESQSKIPVRQPDLYRRSSAFL